MKFIVWAISSNLREMDLVNLLCYNLYIIIHERNEMFWILIRGLGTATRLKPSPQRNREKGMDFKHTVRV
jgi:hypothetical protein